MGLARGAPAPVPPVGRLIVRAVMVVWSEDFTDRMPFLPSARPVFSVSARHFPYPLTGRWCLPYSLAGRRQPHTTSTSTPVFRSLPQVATAIQEHPRGHGRGRDQCGAPTHPCTHLTWAVVPTNLPYKEKESLATLCSTGAPRCTLRTAHCHPGHGREAV